MYLHLLYAVTTTPRVFMCPADDDVYLPPNGEAFITNEPEALLGEPGTLIPGNDVTVIEPVIPGDDFTVMELKFTVNPITGGSVTIVFELDAGNVLGNVILSYNVSVLFHVFKNIILSKKDINSIAAYIIPINFGPFIEK